MEAPSFELTPTVERLLKTFYDQKVTVFDLAGALLQYHPEYGGGRGGKISIGPVKGAPEKGARDWLEEATSLLIPGASRILHGRLLLFLLGLADPNLGEQLRRDDFLEALLHEIKEPVDTWLSEEGRRRWSGEEPVQSQSATEVATLDGMADSVPMHPDDPVLDEAKDQLGRMAFARFLARRLQTVEAPSAYAVHLYGAWGSGKSTILNFLKQCLEAEDWIVVEFNAWRNQHVQPPWWVLLDSVYRTQRHLLSPGDRLREVWWRFKTARLYFLIGFFGVLAFIASFLLPVLQGNKPFDYAQGIQSLNSIISGLVALWGFFNGASRSMLFGSAKAAQTYVDSVENPMTDIKKRFEKLIGGLLSRQQRRRPKARDLRVAIFIDDLDRCKSEFVVHLLEGLQTLFRNAKVTYVVAADRNWLNACYEQQYTNFKTAVKEPGKSLGDLFLQKTFQFSTGIPGIPNEIKESYWESLIRMGARQRQLHVDAVSQKLRSEVQAAKDDLEAEHLLETAAQRDPLEQQALREEIVLRLAEPEVQERTEHTLREFIPYLDDNPRALKRLVNTYSMNRALSILSRADIDRKQLAIWTIIGRRWPQLGDFLREYPSQVQAIKDRQYPEAIAPLFRQERTEQIILEVLERYGFDEQVIGACTRLEH